MLPRRGPFPMLQTPQRVRWINLSSGSQPPTKYFDDPCGTIGAYSVQFTATDTYAWSGIQLRIWYT